MKLTDAERLILINQYKILLKLEPDDDIGYEMAIDDLVHGSYGPPTDVFPKLGEAMEFDRVKFASDVLRMYLDRRMPFYGFEDERLNKYARFEVEQWGDQVEFAEGTPLSDDDYRAMLAERRFEKRRARRLSNHQQV